MVRSDTELIEAYRRGDSAAFAELYDRYIQKIYDFLYFKTHHRETAEDLTSQTFIKAFEALGQFNADRGTFSAWIHGIARNGVIDHYRSQKRTEPIEDAWDLSSKDNPLQDADTSLRLEQIRSVLSALSADQRDVILLRLWNGYSFAEVADALGKTEAACKMSYKRGLERVRKELILSLLLLFFFS